MGWFLTLLLLTLLVLTRSVHAKGTSCTMHGHCCARRSRRPGASKTHHAVAHEHHLIDAHFVAPRRQRVQEEGLSVEAVPRCEGRPPCRRNQDSFSAWLADCRNLRDAAQRGSLQQPGASRAVIITGGLRMVVRHAPDMPVPSRSTACTRNLSASAPRLRKKKPSPAP